jgi:hypothetical protein
MSRKQKRQFQKPSASPAQGSEVYAGSLTAGFKGFAIPRINTLLIAQYEQNAVLADPVRNLKRLMFKDEPTYTVYDPNGEEDAGLSQAAKNLGRSLDLFAKAQWCFHDRVFGGCSVFSCGWGNVPVEVGQKTITMKVPTEFRHLPWNSFWQQPPGYMTTYNPIMPGIVVDPLMVVHVFQAVDQFVDLGRVGGTPSGQYHLVEIWPRHPKEGTNEAAALATWLANPSLGTRPTLSGPTCFKIIKDPSAQDPAGLPDCLPLVPLVTMYDHANQAENQRIGRVGSPVIFPKVDRLTADNTEYAQAMMQKWGKDTVFLCSSDGVYEFLDPHIHDNASALERMTYLKDMITAYFNPATPLKQATGGSSMGRNYSGAAYMLNGYINNTLAWIEDGFEDVFNEWLDLNGFSKYYCTIEFPRQSNRNDVEITNTLNMLANHGAVSPNDLRQNAPGLNLPRLDDPAYDLPVPATQNPGSGVPVPPGSVPVGNVGRGED